MIYILYNNLLYSVHCKCTVGWALFSKVYFAHLLFCRAHFPDSHGMFLFAYYVQEPSGICIFMIFTVQIVKTNL